MNKQIIFLAAAVAFLFLVSTVHAQEFVIHDTQSNIVRTGSITWHIEKSYLSKYIDTKITEINDTCYAIETHPTPYLLQMYNDSQTMNANDFRLKYQKESNEAQSKGRNIIADIMTIGRIPFGATNGFTVGRIAKSSQVGTFSGLEDNYFEICGETKRGNYIRFGFASTVITIENSTFQITIDPATEYCLSNCEHEIEITNLDSIAHSISIDNITIENPEDMTSIGFYYRTLENYTYEVPVYGNVTNYYENTTESICQDENATNCWAYNDTYCACNETGIIDYETKTGQKIVERQFTSYDIQPNETFALKMKYKVPIGSYGKYNITLYFNGEYYNIDPWWNSSWQYRRQIDINYTGSSLSCAVINLTVDTASLIYQGHLDPDCQSIRFVNDSDEIYWDFANYGDSTIGCNTNSTLFYVYGCGNSTLYMYYDSVAKGWANNTISVPLYSALIRLDENSGTSVYDSVDGNNGSFIDVSGSSLSWSFDSVYGYSVYYPDGYPYIEMDYSPYYEVSGDFSVGAWIKTSYVGGYRTILSKYYANSDESWKLATQTNDRGIIFTITDTSNTRHQCEDANPSYQINDSKWHFVVAVWNGSYMNSYVDGVLVKSCPYSGDMRNSSQPLRIGAFGYGDVIERWTQGNIDNAFVINRSLNDDEIKFMYENYAIIGSEETQSADAISIDFVSPTPENNTVTDNNTITINATSNATLTSCLLEWSGVNESMTISGNYCYITKSSLSDGVYQYRVHAFAGSSYNVTEYRTIAIDTTSPTITIYSPENTTYTTTTISLDVFADETIDTWWYSLNSGSNTTFTPNTTITVPEGLNHLEVYANDSAGNTGSSEVYFTYSPPPTQQTLMQAHPELIILPLAIIGASLYVIFSVITAREISFRALIAILLFALLLVITIGFIFTVPI